MISAGQPGAQVGAAMRAEPGLDTDSDPGRRRATRLVAAAPARG
jgi:hypothetical protein